MVQQNCFLCKKKLGLIEDKFNRKDLTSLSIPIPEDFGLKDKMCSKCFHSKKDNSKNFLIQGKYERELDYVQNIIGSFIPIWAFFVLMNLGWRYGTLSLLTNYVMIITMVVSGISLIGNGTAPMLNKSLGIVLLISMIPLHGFITWYWIKKHNARVRANKNPNISPTS